MTSITILTAYEPSARAVLGNREFKGRFTRYDFVAYDRLRT